LNFLHIKNTDKKSLNHAADQGFLRFFPFFPAFTLRRCCHPDDRKDRLLKRVAATAARSGTAENTLAS
jgi:hypothetical protein